MPFDQRNRGKSITSTQNGFILSLFSILLCLLTSNQLFAGENQPLEPGINAGQDQTLSPQKNETENPSLEKSDFFKAFLDDHEFNQYIMEKGIERSDRVSTYLLLKGQEALDAGRGADAIQLGTKASQISPMSPSPYFFLIKAQWNTDPAQVIDILFHFANGIQLVFGDILYIIPVLSPFLIFLLLAIFLSILCFIGYSLFNFLPIWAHEISEWTRHYLHPLPAGLLFTILLCGPLLLGLPFLWFILFAFFLFWGFYNKPEKAIVFTFILLLGAIPWILPFIFTIFTANGGLLLDEMSRNYHSDYLWTPPPVELNESGWESAFIRASYEAQRGNYKRATLLYQTALEKNPDSPMILNNLGNLAFYTKNYKQAITYYEQAIQAEPSLVSAHYNMSQAYREMLLFKKGEATFAEASKLNAQSTEQYAMKSARYPNFPVIDERFTKADVVKRLLTQTGESDAFSEKVWQGLIGPVDLKKAPMIALLWVIILSISRMFHKTCLTGKPCAFCKKSICRECERRLFSYQVCRPCEMRFMTVRKKSDFAIVENAVKRIPARLYPLFIFPGGGHLFACSLFHLAFFRYRKRYPYSADGMVFTSIWIPAEHFITGHSLYHGLCRPYPKKEST